MELFLPGWLHHSVWRLHQPWNCHQIHDRWDVTERVLDRSRSDPVCHYHAGWSPREDHTHRCALWAPEEGNVALDFCCFSVLCMGRRAQAKVKSHRSGSYMCFKSLFCRANALKHLWAESWWNEPQCEGRASKMQQKQWELAILDVHNGGWAGECSCFAHPSLPKAFLW